jgi:hypothetical protein
MKKAPGIYARLYASSLTHPKLVELSDGAWRLYFSAIVWSRQNLTDGHVPAAVVPMLLPARSRKHLANVRRMLNECVAFGLVSLSDSGDVTITDYDHHQETRSEVESKRESRSRSGKLGAEAVWSDGKRHSERRSERDSKRDGKRMARERESERETTSSSRARESAHEPPASSDDDDLHAEIPDDDADTLAQVVALVGPLRAGQRARVLVAISEKPNGVLEEARKAHDAQLQGRARSAAAVFLAALQADAHKQHLDAADYAADIRRHYGIQD